MSTLQSAHQHRQTSWLFDLREESEIIKTQRNEGRKAKKKNPTKYRKTCALCSREFICESRDQKYCQHECYAKHRSITKANPYKNLECISCLSILGFGCKAIARRLYKTNYATIRKVIRDRRLPRSNSKRAANREFENGRTNVLSDREREKRETIKRIDENLKVIRRLKKKCQTIMEAQKNCPYKIDWRNASSQVINYWANIEQSRMKSRRSCYRQWRTSERYRIKSKLRRGVHRMLRLAKARKNGRRTTSFLGTTFEDAKQRLEAKFKKGMTWQNHGSVWEIDHVVPLASFDLSKPESLKFANHISNLQPLFIYENRKKRDVVPLAHQFEIL
jgi:hypothetical protein